MPGADGGGGGGAADGGGDGGEGLSSRYPGGVGLGEDPAVVWFEDFEAGSIEAIAGRYDEAVAEERWELVTDTPGGAGAAMAWTAGDGVDAVHVYKQLPDHDEWFVRWYVRYEDGVDWHHSGMWFGGYNPGMPYPSPQAGRRPGGDDRFSVSVEPVYDDGAGNQRFDFYNYWSAMHSWMDEPIDDSGTAYYGNSLVHRSDLTIDEESWVCLEAHLRLNPDPSSSAGAVLELWKNDQLVARFDDSGPTGYWIRDKFCPEGADGAECTDYPAPADTTLDQRWRTDEDLRLNAFWPQNYISEGGPGTLVLDQMVVATERVGCMR